MTFILHDCCHGTLFASPLENEVVGWVTAALLVTSFPSFRRLHLLHHKHYRRAEDPQASDYNDLVPGRDRILRHLLAPLFFLMAWERVGAYFALHHSGMSREERARPVNSTGMLREHATSGVLIALAQAGVVAISTHLFTFWPGYLMYVVSLSTIGLFLSRLRSYLEHGNLFEEDVDRLVARTHPSNFFERHMLAPMWFNFHHEHHLWPQVPSRWLPKVYREVTANILPASDFSRSYVASLRQLARASKSGSSGA
jgi:fatty acid desaturase